MIIANFNKSFFKHSDLQNKQFAQPRKLNFVQSHKLRKLSKIPLTI